MQDTRRGGWLLRPRLLLSVGGLLALVGLCALAVFFFRRGQAAPARPYELFFPSRDTIVATVNASGQIAPAQVANLSFTSPGRVVEVLVSVGAEVRKGDVLARLDTRELEIRVDQAAAALDQARASYEKLLAGATPQEIAASEAQLRQAQAQFRQTSGSVTRADLDAAQAQLAQAQAQLAQLEAGPKETDLRTTEAQLVQAEAQLASQRDQLSTAKTNAKLQMDQAVDALTQAQSRYSTAKSNWEYVERTGQDPARPSTGLGGTQAPKLNDLQRQQYYDTFVQAEASLHSAESTVAQAEVNYNNARQAEVNGIRVAEQQVTTAQANLEKLRAGADPDQIAAARAQVASAQANLNKLRGEQRSGALQAAQAAVDQANANLERIRSGANTSDLEVARSQIQSAQASLDLARLALEDATLTAPFDGTVAQVNLKVGEVPVAAQPPVVLADLASYYVDVAVDEIDVSRLQAGQPVTLTLDALPGLALAGQVESIAPLATAESGVASYAVRVTTMTDDRRVRSGMSTNADIVVARKEGALLVPRRAVRNDRGQLIVDLPRDQALCRLPRDQRPPTVDLIQRSVQTGLGNEQVIEITSELDEQTCVYVEGVDARLNPLTGPPQGVRNR